MDNQTITHVTINGKYKVQYDLPGSATKGTVGFKVEANGDDLEQTMADAVKLKEKAEYEVREG